MKSTELRQLIRESINEYIREIDEAGTRAGLQAKIEATENAIIKREKVAAMEGIDEAYHEMLDKSKMKEIGNEIKALKKSLEKLKKQLDKLNNKADKAPKAEKEEEKEIVDEVNIDETFPPSGPQLEEDSLNEEMVGGVNYDSTIAAELKAKVGNLDKLTPYVLEKGDNVQSDSSGKIHVTDSETKKKIIYKDIADFLRGIGYQVKMNESFLHMQKLAGLITEVEYKQKLEEFDMDQFSLGSAPKASFEDKWNTVPNANKEVLKKSTGKEPILIMASSKGSNHLVAKGSDSKFYLYTFTQAANPGEPKGPFNSEEDAKKQIK